jgi:hypothetical protein
LPGEVEARIHSIERLFLSQEAGKGLTPKGTHADRLIEVMPEKSGTLTYLMSTLVPEIEM